MLCSIIHLLVNKRIFLKKMKPVDVIFTFATHLNPDEQSSYAGTNKLDSFCQTLTNKLISKNPDIKISWYGIEIDFDFVSAEVCVQKITDKDTMNNLIDDIKNGEFDADFNEYRVYDSQV